MIRSCRNRLFIAAVLCAASFSTDLFAGGERQISCILHLHSTFSGGKHIPLDELVEDAARRHIDVIIPSDHDIMRWEYGLWPLRRLLRTTYFENSVLHTGPLPYLNEVKRLRERYPSTIIIPGAESAPFYYWQGSPFNGTLTLNDWHKHMLVFGLENADDYTSLPLVSNDGARRFNPLLLWPLVLILFAASTRRYRVPLLAVAAIFLFNNYPYTSFSFDPYHRTQGEKPYQKLIDYARSKGALVFWAHPEAVNWSKPVKYGSVSVMTPPYPRSLLGTVRYSGFALYGEGHRDAGIPGGPWDQVLLEYCRGSRKDPVWAIGELDYGEASNDMESIQNLLWVKEKTKEEALASIAAGRYCVLWRTKEWRLLLDDFLCSSGSNQTRCGGEIAARGAVRLRFSLRTSDEKPHTVKITVVKDGAVAALIEAVTPAAVIYEDPGPLSSGRHYYRAVITERYPASIALNPVFVTAGN